MSRLAAIRERRVDLVAADHARLQRWVDDPKFELTAQAERHTSAL